MASVVWLMYLADIAGNLQQFLGIVGGFGFVLCGAVAFFMNIDNDPSEYSIKPVRGYAAACLVAVALCCAMPSKETLYAAAAITAGDKALATPTGDKAVRALNAWLDKQIADASKDKN